MRRGTQIRQVENSFDSKCALVVGTSIPEFRIDAAVLQPKEGGIIVNGQPYLPNQNATIGIAMKRRLMEILACPIDKYYPLELHVFEEKEEIAEGLLVCPQCNRWYPISDEIPQMLPDDLREAKEDLDWLVKWKVQVPAKVLAEGKPFHLK